MAGPVRRVRVLHLAGSPTSDFHADLSRLYAADALALLGDDDRYEHVVAWVDPQRRWRFPDDLSPAAIDAAPTIGLAGAVERLGAAGLDVALPQMFCLAGMTDYRALLAVLGLDHPGNRADVMALGADKARTRAVVAAAGVLVPPGQVVRPGEAATVDLPVVVKPVDSDNSFGVTLVRSARDLPAAVEEACRHSARALVEGYVRLGREVRCGVVDVRGELACLPLEEYAVDEATKPVRDRADKLRPGDDGGLGLVAKDAEHAWIVPTDDPVTPAVHEAARLAYEALGCRSYGLFDFRVDPEGRPWFLEAGLYCSYARTSVLCTMAAAAGTSPAELFALGIEPIIATTPRRTT